MEMGSRVDLTSSLRQWARWASIVMGLALAVAGYVSMTQDVARDWRLKAASPQLVLNDAAEAAAHYLAGDFDTLPGTSVNRYQAGDLWLALEMPESLSRVPGNVLSVWPTTLPEVELYRLNSQGQPLALGRAGLKVPRDEWPMVARGPVFVLDSPAPGTNTFLLKVSARRFALAVVKVETAAQHHGTSERDMFWLGCVLSLAVVTLVATLLAWRLSGNTEFLLWAGQALSGMAYIAYTHGLIAAYLPPLPYEVHVQVFGLVAVVMIWTVSAVGVRFLDLKALHPAYPRWINGVALAAAPLSLLSVWLGWGMALVRVTQAALSVLFTAGVISQMRRGHPMARRYGVGGLLLTVSGMVYLLLQVGLVPATHLTLNAWQYALGACDLVLLQELVSRFLQQRRQARQEQAHLQDLLRDEKAQLEQRVVERTAALMQANAELERAELQQRELLSMASHEFRSPASAIQTTLEALEYLREPMPRVVQDRLEHLQAAARRLTFLANRLIEHDRWRERSVQAQIESLDARAWLIEVLTDYPDALPLSLDLPSEPLWARFDPVLMRIACQNLIDNALNQAAQEHALVSIQLRADEAGLWLSVSDNGPGVPEAFKPQVFDRFFSPKASLRKGLGLSIVRTVAQLHGGEVQLADAVPQGARFTIRVPMTANDDQSASAMSLTQ
ncbi:MAG: hypothetical protein C4K60_00620 [Ideonella sp. MAG2]|nr:MAG: hypothetical protein C4K60_00620 [Ideonella sp. MAG2]